MFMYSFSFGHDFDQDYSTTICQMIACCGIRPTSTVSLPTYSFVRFAKCPRERRLSLAYASKRRFFAFSMCSDSLV